MCGLDSDTHHHITLLHGAILNPLSFPPASLQFLRSLHLTNRTLYSLRKPKDDIQKNVARMQELVDFMVANVTLTHLALRVSDNMYRERQMEDTLYKYWIAKDSGKAPQFPRMWTDY